MRKAIPAALLLVLMSYPALAADPYRILRSVKVGGEGGFDYVTADSAGRKLYIARSGKNNPRLLAFDLDSLKQVGEIDGISAHGAVVDPANHHGFASSKPLTMFDSTSTTTLKSIAVDGNPDGLTLDQAAHRSQTSGSPASDFAKRPSSKICLRGRRARRIRLCRSRRKPNPKRGRR